MTFPPVKGSQMQYATALSGDHLLRPTSVQGLWKPSPCGIWPAGLLISMLLYIYIFLIWELQLPSDMPDIEDILRDENQLDEAQVQMYRDDMN